MSLFSVNNILAPLNSKVNVVAILTALVVFAIFRLSTGHQEGVVRAPGLPSRPVVVDPSARQGGTPDSLSFDTKADLKRLLGEKTVQPQQPPAKSEPDMINQLLQKDPPKQDPNGRPGGLSDIERSLGLK